MLSIWHGAGAHLVEERLLRLLLAWHGHLLLLLGLLLLLVGSHLVNYGADGHRHLRHGLRCLLLLGLLLL